MLCSLQRQGTLQPGSIVPALHINYESRGLRCIPSTSNTNEIISHSTCYTSMRLANMVEPERG